MGGEDKEVVQQTTTRPWWAFWATNGGAAGSKNMPASAAVTYWLTGGLRMPWIEAWNYIYLVTGLIIYFFMCPLSRAATLEWDWIAFVVLRECCHRQSPTQLDIHGCFLEQTARDSRQRRDVLDHLRRHASSAVHLRCPA